MTALPPDPSFLPVNALGRGPSLLVDVALLGFALGALLFGLRSRANRMHHASISEHARLGEQAELQVGRDVVVHGTVMADAEGGELPVVVDAQSDLPPPGADERRAWIAAFRPRAPAMVEARPFLLNTAQGVLRVEPNSRVMVATDWDDAAGTGSRRAPIRVGDAVYVYGRLTRTTHAFAGYRGGALGWTLRPAPRGRIVIATEALRDRYEPRIQLLRRFLRVALPLWLLFHVFASTPFVAATFFGTQTSTQVSSLSQRPWGAGTLVTETEDGLVVSVDVPRETREAIEERGITRVPLLRVGSLRMFSFVGGEAWTLAPLVWSVFAGWVVALFALRVNYYRATPWYDR